MDTGDQAMKSRKVLLLAVLSLFCGTPLFAGDWYRSVPDSAGVSIGWDCSLALDSQGNPHIAYFDNDYGALRYAAYDGTAWTVTVVDSSGWVGEHCSLTLDANDRPHISYQKGILAAVNVGLKYATLHDTGWATIFVDREDAGTPDMRTSIAIDPDGYPCISYQSIMWDQLKFAFLNEDGWSFREITSLNGTYFTKLRFMSDGRPVIGFIDENDDQTAAIFKFAVIGQDYETWTIQQHSTPLLFLQYYDWTDFAIDSQDNYHLVYLGTDFHFYYEYFDGFMWSGDDLYDFYPTTASIAIDNNDIPHIVIGKDSDLYYYSLEGDQWREELIDDQVHTDFNASLAFDNSNTPHFALQGTPYGSTKEQSLMYYTYISGTPQIELPVAAYDYGEVSTGSFLDWECGINNTGDAPLTIDEFTFSSGYFSVINAGTPFSIPPGESETVTIRFSPVSDQEYQDALSIHSNDPVTPVASVSLEGTGVSAGDVGSVTVGVFDIFFEEEYGTLNDDTPLHGASVAIFDAEELIAGPETTNTDGEATLPDIPTGDYVLRISDSITLQDGVTEKALNKQIEITIGPGANSYSFSFPESLVVQKYATVHALTHLETNKFSVPFTFSYAESESGVLATLDDWNADLDEGIVHSLTRLLLTESIVHELFDDGFTIGIEATHNVGDLISFIFYSDDWVHKLLTILLDLVKAMEPGGSRDLMNDLLQMLMEEAIKQAVLDMVTEGVELAAAEVPAPGEQMINAIWRDIKKEYCGYPDLSLSPSNWSHVKSLVYDMLKIVFFQEVYVDQLTGPSIKQAGEYAAKRQFNGDLFNAYETKTDFVSDRKNDIEITKEIAYGLRTSANLLMMTTATLDWVATLDPTGIAGEIAGQASFYMKTAAYVNVANAFGMSAYQFFITPQKIDRAVDRVYFPDGKPEGLSRELLADGSFCPYAPDPSDRPLAKMSLTTHQMLVNNVTASASAYDSLLSEIRTGFERGEYLNSVAKLEQLVGAERQLKQSMREARSPIQAVASQADTVIATFPSMYDSLKSYHGKAAEERFINYLTVFCMGLDSSAEIRGEVIEQLERTSQSQQTLTSHLTTTLDSVVTEMEVPAIVTVSYSEQDYYTLDEDQTANIRVRLRNSGSLTAEEVSVKLSTSDGLAIETADSLFIGDLDPGQESKTCMWTVRAVPSENKQAVWNLDIRTGNAATYSDGGIITFPEKGTSIEDGGLTDESVYCYPNPFNPDENTVTLRYSLETGGAVTIRIYDAGGNLVETVLDGENQPAGTPQSILWDGRNGAGDMVTNGVYFFVIESSENERAVGKVAVLR